MAPIHDGKAQLDALQFADRMYASYQKDPRAMYRLAILIEKSKLTTLVNQRLMLMALSRAQLPQSTPIIFDQSRKVAFDETFHLSSSVSLPNQDPAASPALDPRILVCCVYLGESQVFVTMIHSRVTDELVTCSPTILCPVVG